MASLWCVKGDDRLAVGEASSARVWARSQTHLRMKDWLNLSEIRMKNPPTSKLARCLRENS